MSIDLAKPRIFAFEDRSRSFTLTCKQISKEMWQKYFAGIVSTSELKDGNTSNTYDSAGARLELLEASLVDATGYTADGSSITAIDGWQKKLPMKHRRAAADLLTAVERVPLADDDYFELGVETVALKSTWTAVDGRMQEVVGLRHSFASPTADHQKRYSRAMSRSVVVGGSRTGLTRWPGAQGVLIEIYDELIQGASGYTFNDSPVNSPEDLVRWMDSYHKVAATSALFEPLEVPAE